MLVNWINTYLLHEVSSLVQRNLISSVDDFVEELRKLFDVDVCLSIGVGVENLPKTSELFVAVG